MSRARRKKEEMNRNSPGVLSSGGLAVVERAKASAASRCAVERQSKRAVGTCRKYEQNHNGHNHKPKVGPKARGIVFPTALEFDSRWGGFARCAPVPSAHDG